MIVDIALVLGGLALLVLGGDLLVRGAGALAEKAGVSRFMTKPFSNSEMLDAVRDLIAS